MLRFRVSVRFLLVSTIVWAAMACVSPLDSPEVEWVHEGGAANLEQDQAACRQRAAKTGTVSRRFDPVARGNVFMGCMSARGWRQVEAGS